MRKTDFTEVGGGGVINLHLGTAQRYNSKTANGGGHGSCWL